MINMILHLSRSIKLPSAGLICLISLLYIYPVRVTAQILSRDTTQIESLHREASNAMQRGNYAIAYCIWKPMADDGDRNAQYNIGWMYHNGYGLSINDKAAFEWWLKSAASGDANSHYALGDLYFQGQGVEKNMSIALGWYISAALRQHEPARETLLELLAKNDTLAQNTIQQLLQSDWQILGDVLQVNVERANIRRGPDTSHPIVTTLEKGQQVIPLLEQKGWTYIGLIGDGVTAWIHTPLLSKPAGIYPKQ